MSARRTVSRPTARLVGVGLHSGRESWIEVHPSAEPGRGIIFRDYETGAELAASTASVVSTNRSTCLGGDGVRVDTVEHLLSALYSYGISDAEIVFKGDELPIADGSALPFVELLESVGSLQLDRELEDVTLDRAVVITDGDGAVLSAVPSDKFWIAAMIDYSIYPAIGTVAATFDGSDFRTLIAPARTYGFHHELDALRQAGLGLGASFDNVVALEADGTPDKRTPLRMPDELVRHKILDLIGDLSLSQKKINAGVVALRPSHTMNVRLARLLLSPGESLGPA